MAAYIIAEVDVTDPEVFEEYRSQVSATLEQYGGKYVVRGGAVERAEGDWNPKRLVILNHTTVSRRGGLIEVRPGPSDQVSVFARRYEKTLKIILG